MNKPVLSRRAFKNVDMDHIDYENDALNILERLIYRGTREDLWAIRDFYGDEKIRQTIVKSKCFGPKEVNFCCLIFDLQIADFVNYEQSRFRAYAEFKDCPEDFEYPAYAIYVLKSA